MDHLQDDGTNNLSVTQMERTPPSYVPQYNRRIVHKRRDQRQLRHRFMNRTHTLIQRLPFQITNDQYINQFFNGSPFF